MAQQEGEACSEPNCVWCREKATFRQAKAHLSRNRFFRLVTYLYAERKLVVFFWVHFMATMITWAHFALRKWAVQEDAVPEGAPHYWLKRIAPPLEFGSMHAILLQMALIPLTMSRFSIAALSESALDRFVPLNRAVRMHIHVGYTMILIVFLATAFFFAFFGVLCADGDQDFCSKFKQEIMITGYIILAFLLVVAGTSFFRHRIPYEIFYTVHHLVFIMYAVVVVHTFDGAERSNQTTRSQTFKWFTATLLFYACDRAAMHLTHKYGVRLLESSTVSRTSGSRMLILKLKRPALFNFRPGQYAFLRLHEIDNHWHPFSIASSPTSPFLSFCIEVFEDASWSGRLWRMLRLDGDQGPTSLQVHVELMGPYGTSLARIPDYSHVLAIGAGSGIVPILSLLRQHFDQVNKLDAKAHASELESHEKKVAEVEKESEERKGSFVSKIAAAVLWCLLGQVGPQVHRVSRRESHKRSVVDSIDKFSRLSGRNIHASKIEMRRAAFRATKSLYGAVGMASMPVLGVTLIGLAISWNTLSEAELHVGMATLLQILTWVFQASFLLAALFIWDANQLLAYVDIVACLISPFASWYWYLQYEQFPTTTLSPGEVTLFCLFIGYMTARFWWKTVRPRHRSWRDGVAGGCGSRTSDRLEVVWVTRNSAHVAEVLPEVEAVWNGLTSRWGKDKAQDVCRFSVYVTDRDTTAVANLRRRIMGTCLFRAGLVHFGRPDISYLIERHSIELITTRRNSYSLLAFCGSPGLASTIHQYKINNDVVSAITGNKRHQMEFVSDSYGGIKMATRNNLAETNVKSDSGKSGEAGLLVDSTGSFSTDDSENDDEEDQSTNVTEHCLTRRKRVAFSEYTEDSGSLNFGVDADVGDIGLGQRTVI